MFLKNQNPTVFANLLSNVFFTAFSCVVIVSAVPSVFLRLHVPLNHWLTVWLGVALFTFFFTQVKVLVSVVNIWVVNWVNVFWTKYEYFFLHECPAYIVHNTTCLVCWFNEKLNLILTVSSTITWSLEPYGISISMYWLR